MIITTMRTDIAAAITGKVILAADMMKIIPAGPGAGTAVEAAADHSRR